MCTVLDGNLEALPSQQKIFAPEPLNRLICHGVKLRGRCDLVPYKPVVDFEAIIKTPSMILTIVALGVIFFFLRTFSTHGLILKGVLVEILLNEI